MRFSRLLLLFAVLAAPLSEAQQHFEIVVSGDDAVGGCFILPIVQHVQQWYSPDRVDYDDVRMIGSADGRRVLALMAGAPLRIVEIRPDGSEAPFYSGAPAAFGLSMAVAANGTVFVTTGGPSNELVRISPAGVLEAAYPLLSDNIAVGADGCTIYYRSDWNVIRRINGCTGAALPDFTSLPSLNDFEVLPSGEVLVSTESEVRLYDASGSFVRVVADLATYGLGDRQADAVAVRGGMLYVAAVDRCDSSNGFLLRLGLADGAELARAGLLMTHANAIVLGAGGPAVPTAGEMALAMLAFALAAGGAFVLKLR